MRIVSWNCAMGFSKKAHLIEALQPDVAVLPEVSMKHIAEAAVPFKAWVGSNPNKGLGVLGFTDRAYERHEPWENLPWHLPFTVDKLNIVGLWAHVHSRDLRYVRVTHEIVTRHSQFLQSGPSLLIGDFNSNTAWDGGHPGRNHSLLVDRLGALGLRSVYHTTNGKAHGAETEKTYFHTRKLHFAHHIDYAFLGGASATLQIGNNDEWLKHSDHMPLILDVDLRAQPSAGIHP
ncbi:endonuclease/exonuclease/phosphatase family protein [Arthrobacter sp. CAL618]|uniref:endonuclease/exonuclease/phosphatase family protein n=1 Tax=Arthrobacter sp. CAL618 TaxID=1055770 RepID=UPI000465F8F1|nr:endonuclease/exonuclease/phosphatase family protein [Arthrobacter sp. CAL618]